MIDIEKLRDEIAMRAMECFLNANSDVAYSSDPEASAPMESWDDFARGAYQMAAAMLKARKEEKVDTCK